MSASVIDRLIACHAAGNLDAAIPGWTAPVEDRTKDNAANRGTNMHLVYAELNKLPPPDAEKLVEAMDYTTKLRRTRRFKALVEVSAKATWLQTEPDTTADLVLYTQDECHVLDLKTGKIPVEARNNGQLLFGAATYGHLSPKAKGVKLHIVNPWAGGITSWFASTVRIGQFMSEAQHAERMILKGDTTFSPGDHCTFCPANPHKRGDGKGSPLCPALMQLYYPKVLDEDEILGL
jgi:hypothetical protein